MIEILSSGKSNTVQDLGRLGYLNVGIGRSGAMDPEALTIANHMIGNPSGFAGLEISIFPFRLRFLRDTAFAVTGAFGPMTLNDQILPGWWTAFARKGDVLTLKLPEVGARSYIAFAGGIDTIPILNSRSTELKSGFGGLEGRGLRRGDMLPLGSEPAQISAPPGAGFGMDASTFRPELFGPERSDVMTLRVIPAAEHDAFTGESIADFSDTVWTVSPEANRQGYRLDGAKLNLLKPLELFSHGIMPGTVQVPPSGQPVIQLADANTCGGYPKIACVISADLWKLGQSRVGQKLKFRTVNTEQAVEAIRFQNRLIDEMHMFAQLARRDKVRMLND